MAETAEWFYIGHYGQLGPLTLDQMEELVQGGVVVRDTFVWRTGMADWVAAERAQELSNSLRSTAAFLAPPPAPTAPPAFTSQTSRDVYQTIESLQVRPSQWTPTQFYAVPSPKSRMIAGVLQIIPGVGRMYLGYVAIGVLQLLVTMCTGFGVLWSWIDGFLILAGAVRVDAYGRVIDKA